MQGRGMQPMERALLWWRGQIRRGEYVVARRDLPGPAERALLASEGYVLPVAEGGAWIIARPGLDTLPGALYPNYWTVVALLLEEYAPAVVERLSAVRLHAEMFTPPAVLHVRQGASGSKRRIEIVPGYELVIRPGEVDETRGVSHEPAGVKVSSDDAATTLLDLPVEALRDDADTVVLWLKSLYLPRPALEAAYARRPRPVVLKRLGQVAREAGNERLAEMVETVLRGAYPHPVGRGHTGRGGAFVVPAYVSQLRTTHHPWLDRQAATFARFRAAMEEELAGAEARLPRFGRDALLAQARAAKAYDAYHSTTIEGYRITPEEVSAVIRGAPVGGHDPEEVRSRMAVAGYSRAFERVLAAVGEAEGRGELSEGFVQELYLDLFAPSVDAGIVPPQALRGWRSEAAYLRGHVYVPPGPEKLPQLMRQYGELVGAVEGRALVRAALAHLEFVTIHPYPDGNGRLARFLMNAVLLGEGLPWITIRNDDRPRYFAALHAAQVELDPLPFARLVLGYAERAAREMEAGR